MTADVTIRAVEPDDYEAVKSIYEQPGAYFGTLQLPYPSGNSWKERLAHPPQGMHSLLAFIDEKPVGHIGMIPSQNARQRHSAHIGMGVHDDYVGRGIGQSLMEAVLNIADNWLNLTRIELSVFVDNERAIALYKRTGFEIEGTFRNYAYRDGQYVDAHTMARLR